ncbi:MAG: gliding motility lipoprotein GldB [Flavobacteriaceae bacterium]
MLKIFCLIFIFLGCSNNKKSNLEIEKIPLEIKFDRFDLEFASVNNKGFQNLKNKYNFLFPSQFPDSLWMKRKNDSIQIMLQNEVNKIFPNIDKLEKESENIYKHLIYYFPSIKVPKFLTLINNVDYQSKVIFTDTIILISLDTFLGSTNKIYNGIPNYIKSDMDKSRFGSILVDKIASSIIEAPSNRFFLDRIIYKGKILLLKDFIIPLSSDETKIGYNKEQIDWVIQNEEYIWKYFIGNELLFKTDDDLIDRFIIPAPFSKFYLEIDNESPGKIGQWIGWQILRSFRKKNPSIKISDILNMSSEELFKKANYKP